MKRHLIIVAAFAALGIAIAAMGTKTRAEKVQPNYIGDCYTLYACQGASIGILSDDQCRSFGGHSIKSGAICFNL